MLLWRFDFPNELILWLVGDIWTNSLKTPDRHRVSTCFFIVGDFWLFQLGQQQLQYLFVMLIIIHYIIVLYYLVQ